MEINGLKVTGNQSTNEEDKVDLIDAFSAHVHLDGMMRLVWLKDTEFNTIEELQTAIEALIIK